MSFWDEHGLSFRGRFGCLFHLFQKQKIPLEKRSGWQPPVGHLVTTPNLHSNFEPKKLSRHSRQQPAEHNFSTTAAFSWNYDYVSITRHDQQGYVLNVPLSIVKALWRSRQFWFPSSAICFRLLSVCCAGMTSIFIFIHFFTFHHIFWLQSFLQLCSHYSRNRYGS